MYARKEYKSTINRIIGASQKTKKRQSTIDDVAKMLKRNDLCRSNSLGDNNKFKSLANGCSYYHPKIRMANNIVPAIQLKIIVQDNKLASDNKRFSERNTKTFRENFLQMMFSENYSCNKLERKLKNDSNNNLQIALGLLDGNWLSNNGAAFCHKCSIKNIEDNLIIYGNKIIDGTVVDTTAVNDFLNAVLSTPIDISTYFNKANGIHEIATKLNNLSKLADGAVKNYYIGNSSTNSAIQAYGDYHYDASVTDDNAPMTPNSSQIWEKAQNLNSLGFEFSDEIRVLDKSLPQDSYWVRNSGFDFIQTNHN